MYPKNVTLNNQDDENRSKRGFTLIEILIVMIIVGLGLMTVAPRIAENTILTDRTEVFFNDIIDKHLEVAKELNTQIYITGFKGSGNMLLHDGSRVEIPAGYVSTVTINGEITTGLEYKIYFYPDGIFDQFLLTFSGEDTLESFPALNKVVHQ
ncbi:MAG: hypothetical protein C0603_04970 [Denitrovibrio sp.]|nr:MAG: hypothetical protein C0603_04970 [Denitrovibrio sp.]